MDVLKRTVSMYQALQQHAYMCSTGVEGILFIFHLKLFEVGRVGFALLLKYINVMNDGVV